MERIDRLIAPTVLGLCYFAVAGAAVGLTRFDGGVAFLWGATALLIAQLSTKPRRLWWQSLVPCAIASTLATGFLGLGWPWALPFMVINMSEAVIGAYALRRVAGQGRALGSLSWLIAFVFAVGIVGPLVASVWAGLVMGLYGKSALAACAHFFAGHALGNLTFTPLVLLILRGDIKASIAKTRRRDKAEMLLLALLVMATTVIVFAQHILPLLFIPILPLMLVTFRLGRGGAAVGVVIVALIGGGFTAAGMGPIQLFSATTGGRLVLFQLYLAATVMTILPVAVDLHRRSRLLREVRLTAERFRLLADHSTDILFHIEVDGRIRYVSPSIRQLGGYEPEQLIGQSAYIVVAPEHHGIVTAAFRETVAAGGETKHLDYYLLAGDGTRRWFETHARAIVDEDGNIDGVLSVVRDISARKAKEEQLSEAALTDMLTGLPNRRAFRAAIDRRLASHEAVGDCLAVVDIDHFKQVNDAYGHDIGDEVLRSFAKVATRMLRHGDFVARVGGEEFAILFPNSTVSRAMLVCDRLRAEMAATSLMVNGMEVRVTISGGVAAIGEGGFDHAFKVADEALYRAKRGGRDQLALAA